MNSRKIVITLVAAAALALVAADGAAAQGNGHGSGHNKDQQVYPYAWATTSAECVQTDPSLPASTCGSSPLIADRTGALDVSGQVTPPSSGSGYSDGGALNGFWGLAGNSVAVPSGSSVAQVSATVQISRAGYFTVPAGHPSEETVYAWLCVVTPTSGPCRPDTTGPSVSPYTARQLVLDSNGTPPVSVVPLTIAVPVSSGPITIEAGIYGIARLGECPTQGLGVGPSCVGDDIPLSAWASGAVTALSASFQAA